MDLDPVFLSRIQFAFLISFHIIFPSFTIGLAAWLATIDGARLVTGNPLYRRVFDFWLKVFAVSFGMGVVTGIVMAFQFGTNWGVLAQKTGSIQGPLLGYEAFTAFMLEATFFGVMLLGRDRVSPRFYFFACCMVSLGTMFSSFWILANNSWMQVPVGHTIVDGRIIPADWWEIMLGPVHDGALAAHAARRVPDDRHVRGRHRRLVRAARRTSRRGPRDAELGSRTGRGPHPGATFLRPPDRRVRAQASAGEVRGDRGALEDAAAGERGAVRDSRRGERAQSLRDRDPEARQLHRLGQLDLARDRAGDVPEGRPAAGADPVLRLPDHGRGWDSSCSRSRGSGTSCAGAAGSRRRAGFSGERSSRFRPASSPSSPAGSRPRSGASRGSCTGCCAPRTRSRRR